MFKFILSFLLFSLFSQFSYAHRGFSGEVDHCRIRVGNENIHFTAYTPTFTQSESYCQYIPNIGPTNLVFDYEGHKLRNVTVEFEITKEPDETRIFYQAPQKIKQGTFNTTIDFNQYGAGEYLAHITIMHQGESLDTHLPFFIGEQEPEKKPIWMTVFLPTLIIAGFIVLFMPVRRKDESED